VLFNRSERDATVVLPLREGTYTVAYATGSWPLAETVTVSGESLRLAVPPLSASVWTLP
jgi:hypothetical protein